MPSLETFPSNMNKIQSNVTSIVMLFHGFRGWSGGAKVLDKLPVPGRPTILITVGQGPTALAVGAGGGCLDIFTLVYPFSPLSPSLWETARYRLKYCLKGPLNPRQPTNQIHGFRSASFTYPYLILSIVVALCLYWRSSHLYKFRFSNFSFII